jgi:23S rRNA (uracil1939-C5)-methyltransferase
MNQVRRPVLSPVQISGVHSSGRFVIQHEEKNYFTHYGIPGETVALQVENRRLGFRTGRITEVLNASPHRVIPACPHALECGGCNWMHIDYNYQRELKRNLVISAFQKYDIPSPDIPEVHASPQTAHYRHRIEYAVHSSACGYHKADDKEIIPINQCLLQSSGSETMRDGVNRFLKEHPDCDLERLAIRENRQREFMIIGGFRSESWFSQFTELICGLYKNVVSVFAYKMPASWHDHPEYIHLAGKPVIEENSGKFRFGIGPSAFYQPNPEQANNLFTCVNKLAGNHLYKYGVDLYCGIGTITSRIADKTVKCLGIEGSAEAIRLAKASAEINNLSHLDFMCGDILETFTPQFISNHGCPDLIVLDPPRSGTLMEIKKTILMAEPEKLIYVSCNPLSLAWDLTTLLSKYRVTEIELFDMFPHTHHVETVVGMEKY